MYYVSGSLQVLEWRRNTEMRKRLDSGVPTLTPLYKENTKIESGYVTCLRSPIKYSSNIHSVNVYCIACLLHITWGYSVRHGSSPQCKYEHTENILWIILVSLQTSLKPIHAPQVHGARWGDI